ncbi:sodium:alanine symporter family protein [Streptococcus gallolyticus]|nr:sodium:alanine symporter family protein [Streptococcus gallolyticus]MBY5040924.1 sodium:alanine symporter family protein [Streptococcus gallolyticus]
MLELMQKVQTFVWGVPLLMLLVGTGLYLTVRLGVFQLFKLPKAFRLILSGDQSGDGEVSSFAALCTALAATVGTGNIVGVATAIKLGGPGALFWMWVAAFLGMATKYAEGFLAIKYRTTDANGESSGGPMYYILLGMGEKWRPLATFFAFSGLLVALFGIGTFTQVNAITSSIHNSFGVDVRLVGILLGLVVALIIFRGIQAISDVATKVVPFMAIVYILATLGILVTYTDSLLPSLKMIASSAFTGTAATGGFVGATMMVALRSGMARGVFSNESGLGSAPIAAAAAKSNHAVEQGLISMTGTFIDTLIICSLTGLSIIVTGSWTGTQNGAALTQSVFTSTYSSWGSGLLTVLLTLFAFTTILGWNYYGERCFEFLFGVKHLKIYRIFFVAMVVVGAFIELELVWVIADIVNGLMALPNLIALLALSPIIIHETKNYFKK